MKKFLVAATFAALIITTTTTVSAKANVRYSTGIVTGAKSITTTDGNVWCTKRKLHLHKGNGYASYILRALKDIWKLYEADRDKTKDYLGHKFRPELPNIIKSHAVSKYPMLEKVWLDTCKGDPGYPDKSYTVKTALVDLDDYTEHEKECNISGYYDSIEELKEIYGDYSDQIIAECIFEETTDGSASTTEMMTEKEADDYIQKYISER